jgi:hypothetical protein
MMGLVSEQISQMRFERRAGSRLPKLSQEPLNNKQINKPE